jgi:TRAP-type C4-dicarboxylate transport system permease small subunit
MKNICSFFWRALDWIQQLVVITTSVAIVVLVVVQVTLRYFFRMPLFGVEELACLFGFWLYFTGAANGSRERTHIKADLLEVFLKNDKRTLNLAKSVVAFITFFLAAVFVQWSFNYFQWSLKSWERSPSLSIPMIYAQVSLLFNAVLMLLYFFIEFLDYARQAMGHEPFRFTQTSAQTESGE